MTTGKQQGGDRKQEQQVAAGHIDTFPPGSRIKNSPQLIACQEANLPRKRLYLGALPCCQVGDEEPNALYCIWQRFPEKGVTQADRTRLACDKMVWRGEGGGQAEGRVFVVESECC